MVDKVLRFLQINALAFLCWVVAFMFWKDYLTQPHQKVSLETLAYTTGPMKHFSGMASLPSGSRTGYWLMLEEPRRDFDVSLGVDLEKLGRQMPEGTVLTVGYSPEVDPVSRTAQAFSLKRGEVECLHPEVSIRSYNESLDTKVTRAILTTLGGFVALGLVWVIRKKVFRSI